MKKVFIVITIFFGLFLASCNKKQDKISSEEAKAIAEDAYIFAYPMLDNYKTMYVVSIWKDSPAFDAPLDTLINKAVISGPEYTAVVRPNNDTFYSQAIIDLRREPMVLSVPAITDNRYYSFQLIDLYTHNFDYIGTRKTGFDAGHYLIAGPEWTGKKPNGIDKIIQTECNFAIALGRTQVYGPDDMEDAQKVMSRYEMQPLSQFLGTKAPEESEPLNFPPYSPEKVKSVEFITYLNFLLGQVQPHPSEADLFKRFAKIGIGPDQPFDANSLDPEIKSAIEAGIASALIKIEKEMKQLGEQKNGWMLVSGAFGNRDFMQDRYLTRAAAAMFGIYGNDLEEAYYPESTLDSDGEALDGSKHKYILHLAKDQLPPVNAFWSLSMYKLPEQLFIENSINRYVISSVTEGLKYNQDGSLDVYIQKDSPGKDKKSNWLPAHDGPFSLQGRMYWPKPEALDPLYVPPAVQKVK